MKKYLLIFATAAIVASCADQDTLKKDILTDNGDEIRFESFTSKQTRAENTSAEYNKQFFAHHNTFQVWGFKNTEVVGKPVFNGDVITVAQDGTSYTYTYSPIRYWDKAATIYEFYAAAPSDGNWDLVDDDMNPANYGDATDGNKGYFKTESTLKGTNLSTATELDYVESFKSSETDVDIDKLIAAPKAVAKNGFNQTIQLDFIHILSRLNITISKASSLDGSNLPDNKKANEQKVVLTDLKVVNLKEYGSFDESKPLNTVATGTNTRWDASNETGRSKPFIYHSIAKPDLSDATKSTTYEVTSEPKYVLQSLVIPQTAAFAHVALDGNEHDAIPEGSYATVAQYNLDHEPDITQAQFEALTEAQKTIAAVPATVALDKDENTLDDAPYIKITYTIKQMTDSEGNNVSGTSTEEEFTAYFNLAAAFKMDGTTGKTAIAFNEGWQNTLNIVISPAEIQFSAMVADWIETTKTLTIE